MGTMMDRKTTAQQVILDAARIARDLAGTARLHKEPEEAARFEQIADEAEIRAARLAKLEMAVISTRPRP